MELCAGTLGEVIDKEKVFTLSPDPEVMYQIANGLHYIHSQNIIHRDIKPDNIFISSEKNGQIKVGDFDRSKEMSLENKHSVSVITGTRSWMAPEMGKCFDQKIECTVDSDTFSAGCVFFVFTTREVKLGGIHPFDGKQDNINDNKQVGKDGK